MNPTEHHSDTSASQWTYPEIETVGEPAPPEWETKREPGTWAIVEIMGHRVRAGTISDAQIAGGTMLRIQHPTVPDHDNTGPLTEYISTAALFGLRPCSRDDAIRIAEIRWRGSDPAVGPAELTAAAEDWDDDDVYIDGEDWRDRHD